MGRDLMGAARALLYVGAVVGSATSDAYNSEEHKMIADMAAADVVVDPSIVLPAPTRFHTVSAGAVQGVYMDAKEFAVGFRTTSDQYDKDLKGPQDNSYYGPDFHQLSYNRKIWIPGVPELRGRRLYVAGNLSGSLRVFSLGDLVALYGDYRKTTYCAGANCYLTNSNTLKSTSPGITYSEPGQMLFKRGYDCFGLSCGWEPPSMAADRYLIFIGSGVVPPFNVTGNVSYNEDDYGEAGWWGDEMMRIATMNDWHFSNGAVAWYVGMHRLALLSVQEAITDPTAWNKALHYEANALHSLTDLFAFGHVVVSRGGTSWGVVHANSEGGSTAFNWMKNVLAQGGAARVPTACGASATCMRIEFPSTLVNGLPPLSDVGVGRSDFMKSYVNSAAGVSWASWANNERTYHDEFNKLGACVRNLDGTSFRILGDGEVRSAALRAVQCGPSAVPGLEVVTAAVRTSVQSLFDAYVALADGSKTVEELGAIGSPHFAALRHVPAFVHYDQNATIGGVTGRFRFNGQWPRYARAIDTITGAGIVPANAAGCEMPYVAGDSPPPAINRPRCQEFPLIVLPKSATVDPGETVQFVARGGTDVAAFPDAPAWVWSIELNGSGGTIDAATGLYTAGPQGGVIDGILVTDTDGIVAKAEVTLTGTPPDAGTGGEEDAGVEADAGSGGEADAGIGTDGGAGLDPGAGPGCGCGADAGAGPWIPVAFLALAGLAVRRRIGQTRS